MYAGMPSGQEVAKSLLQPLLSEPPKQAGREYSRCGFCFPSSFVLFMTRNFYPCAEEIELEQAETEDVSGGDGGPGSAAPSPWGSQSSLLGTTWRRCEAPSLQPRQCSALPSPPWGAAAWRGQPAGPESPQGRCTATCGACRRWHDGKQRNRGGCSGLFRRPLGGLCKCGRVSGSYLHRAWVRVNSCC